MSRSRILPQIAGPMAAFKTAALASLLVDQDFDVRCVAGLGRPQPTRSCGGLVAQPRPGSLAG